MILYRYPWGRHHDDTVVRFSGGLFNLRRERPVPFFYFDAESGQRVSAELRAPLTFKVLIQDI